MGYLKIYLIIGIILGTTVVVIFEAHPRGNRVYGFTFYRVFSLWISTVLLWPIFISFLIRRAKD